MKKFVYIKSYGCQMNVYDSNRMLEILTSLDYESTQDFYQADFIILNTCHIREKASEKVFSDLGRFKRIRDDRRSVGRDLLICVTGCVAQADGKEIKRRAPYVDIIFGTQVYHRLPKFLKKIHNDRYLLHSRLSKSYLSEQILDFDFPIESKFNYSKYPKINGVTAFLSIQEGCNKFCHFCVVPYTRGVEFSRPISDVIKEAFVFVKQGVKEITLLGQNVSAYRARNIIGKTRGLDYLLQELSKIDGLERLRYITSHPRDMNNDLIQVYSQTPKLMSYLHLPIQSGSNKILKSMNRGYTVEEYCAIIENLKVVRPDIAFSTDFIVGYPGEDNEDFEKTLELVRNVKYAQSYSFKYSLRPGTPAAYLEGQVEESIKSNRLIRLQKLLFQQQIDFNISLIGTIQIVLIERVGTKQHQKVGLTPYLQYVYFQDSDHVPGDFVRVLIREAGFKSLCGELVF